MRSESPPQPSRGRIPPAPLIAWAVFLFAQPFYVIPTGLPQPGDLLLLPLVPIALYSWQGQLSRDGLRVLKALLLFTIWVAIVDYAWVLILGNWVVVGREGMMLFPLYYVFNLVLALVALVLYQRYRDEFLRVTLYTVLATVAMLAVASLLIPGVGTRGRLFFANPNQLGYHALLSGCIIALTQRQVGLGTFYAALGVSGCAYLAVISASRSAVLGVLVLVVLITLSNLRVIIVASIAATIAVQLGGGPLTKGIEVSQERAFTQRQSHLSFFEQRGYDRIENNPEYVVFGAGEGATSRFKESTAIGAAEIHSSAAMLLFCYGIIGVLLFGRFLWTLMRQASLRALLMLVPPLLYTFAHQGLRFSLLWVLVAVFIVVKRSPAQLAITRGRLLGLRARPARP